jgi:hypothetical protein
MPCFKLGLRFGRDDVIKRFLASGRTGFSFRVITEGKVQAGDPIVLVERAVDSAPVSEVTRLYARDKTDLTGLRRIAAVAPLPDDWRDYFKEQLARVADLSTPRLDPVMGGLPLLHPARESARRQKRHLVLPRARGRTAVA